MVVKLTSRATEVITDDISVIVVKRKRKTSEREKILFAEKIRTRRAISLLLTDPPLDPAITARDTVARKDGRGATQLRAEQNFHVTTTFLCYDKPSVLTEGTLYYGH